jgi:hypothetical protein
VLIQPVCVIIYLIFVSRKSAPVELADAFPNFAEKLVHKDLAAVLQNLRPLLPQPKNDIETGR